MDALQDRITAVMLASAVVVGAIIFVWTAADLFSSPYDLDYSEGFVIEDTQRLLSGEQFYPDPSLSNGFESVKYPPVYYLVLAGVSRVTGLSLPVGRTVNILATFLVVAMLVLIVHRRTGQKHLIPLLFLAPFVTLFTGITIRVDMLALLLSLLGLYTFIGGRRYAATGLFLLAFFTKQSFVAGIVAAVVTLAWDVEWHEILTGRKQAVDAARPFLSITVLYLAGLGAGILASQLLLGAFVENVFLANASGVEVRWDLLNWVHVSFLPLFGLAAYYIYIHRDVLVGTYFGVSLVMMLLQMLRGGAWVYAAIEPVAAAVLAVSLLHVRTPPVRRYVAGILLLQVVIFLWAPPVSGPLHAVHTMDDVNRETDQRLAALATEDPPVYIEHVGYQLGSGDVSPEIWGVYEQYTAGTVTGDELVAFFERRNYSRIITYKRLEDLPIERYLKTHYRPEATMERRDMLLHRESWTVHTRR